MALPQPPGLTPAEVGFLCEMELVTVIPRQRLDSIELLGSTTPVLNPPLPATLPLWLALLLKRQGRANIQPPGWLSAQTLGQILEIETDERTATQFSPGPQLPALRSEPSSSSTAVDNATYLVDSTRLEISPPFVPDTCTSRAAPDALPYHYLEIAHLLLLHAGDNIADADNVRRILRDLREARMSKLRRGFRVLDAGAGVKMNGVGAMEIAEVRGFVGGVVDGLRRINRPREEARREREAEERENGFGSSAYPDDDDDYNDNMQL